MTQRFRGHEGGFTLVELLVAVVIAGTIAAALSSAFIVGSKTTVEAKTRLQESSDAQLLTNYFRADAASAAYFSPTTPPPGCSLDAGVTPVANFGWIDYVSGAPVQNSALYFRKSSTLTRRYCEGNVKKHDVAVVKNLSSATAPSLSCPPLASCAGVASPSQVQLTVTEASNRYAYTVQGTNRTDPSSGSPYLGNISVYVGGSLSMNSATKVLVNNGGVAYVGTVSKCTNNANVVADVMYTASGSVVCGSDGDIEPFPDPLSALEVPTRPGANGTKSGTCKGKDAWNPGYYSGKLTATNHCLKSGIYYLDGGASFTNVTTEDAGVLIYVNNGNVNFEESNTFVPRAMGIDQGVSIFMRRDLGGTITVQPKNGSVTTIDGVVYAAGGTLELKNNNATLGLIGAVVVKDLLMTGNADASIS